jgi:hypothetical protein
VYGLVLEEDPLWRVPILVVIALVGLTVATRFWGPTAEPDRRRWYVIAENGLLVWYPGAANPAAAERWATLRVDWTGTVYQLTWRDDEDKRHRLALKGVSGLDDLRHAVNRSGRVPRWTRRRRVGTVAAAVAAAFLVWSAVPVALDVVLGERPDKLGDLAKLCDGDGDGDDGLGRAAPYQGRGLHPIVVYGEDTYSWGNVKDDNGTLRADTVQLVGCVSQIGTVSPDPLVDCPYEGGHTVTIYQGRYQVEIREARTARLVSTFPMEGSTDVDCQEYIYVRRGERSHGSYDTDPDDQDYLQRLLPLIDGPAI